MIADARPRGLLDWIVCPASSTLCQVAPPIRPASSAAPASDSTLLRDPRRMRVGQAIPAGQLAHLVADGQAGAARVELCVVVLERQAPVIAPAQIGRHAVARRARPAAWSSTSSRSAKDSWDVMNSLIDAVAGLLSSGPTSTMTRPASSGGRRAAQVDRADSAHRMSHHDNFLEPECGHRRGEIVGGLL